ncbi:MAG: YvrJ family protein [Solibacillus sp.]
MEDFIPYLDYGFSFVISIYLLIRMEKKIEELTKSIQQLNNQQKS